MELNKISSGSVVLDELLDGGYEKDVVTIVYGPGGSGKTNVCILAAVGVARSKKVIFVDTEGNFSVERLKQVCPYYRDVIKNMVFLNPTSFKGQMKAFEKLKEIVDDKIGMIIVDTIGSLYRLELGKGDNVYDINRELGQQLSYLTEIARKKKIPVLITNQVYSRVDSSNRVVMVGGDIVQYGTKCIIELKKGHKNRRIAILKKHRSISEGKETLFEITDNGIEKVKEVYVPKKEKKK